MAPLRTIVLLLLLLLNLVPSHAHLSTADGSEHWGYIDVRPGAHLFWWLYFREQAVTSSSNDVPLIMWLQGGPGGSGVGFGNFQEVGPLAVDLKPRKSTWLNVGHLLFVDFPVGTGFSYVENSSFLASSDEQATIDMLAFVESFFASHKSLAETPFFVVGESYGGKFATDLGVALTEKINAGSLDINFKGIALGDSWTSPLDFMYSWPWVLQTFSLVDEAEARSLLRYADLARSEMESGRFANATMVWSDMQEAGKKITDDVDFYNLLKHHSDPYKIEGMAAETTDLAHLMNGPIRQKLRIIPNNISWSQFSDAVFDALSEDFMKDNINQVDKLLAAGVNVTIYTGQLDLLACPTGTETWVRKLKWPGLSEFLSAKRSPLYCEKDDHQTAAFMKRHKNLSFFWIMNAGHRVPSDNPCMGLKMLQLIVNQPASDSLKPLPE